MNSGARTLMALLVTLGLAACSSGQGEMETPEPEETVEAAAEPEEEAATAGAMSFYTPEQADRGEDTFEAVCSFCHATSQFSGSTFMRSWGGAPVDQLYQLVASTMPYDAPGSLSQQQYVDVVAYMLALNDLPEGDTELPTDMDALSQMTIEAQ